MKRVGSAIWAIVLCAVLASLPILLQPELEYVAHRSIETNLPAEIDELSEAKVDERNEDKAYTSSVLNGPSSRSAVLFLRLHLSQAVRHDDPRGSLTHGLRAPPA